MIKNSKKALAALLAIVCVFSVCATAAFADDAAAVTEAAVVEAKPVRMARIKTLSDICVASDMEVKCGILGDNTLVNVVEDENGNYLIDCNYGKYDIGIRGWIAAVNLEILSDEEVEWIHTHTPEPKPIVVESSSSSSPAEPEEPKAPEAPKAPEGHGDGSSPEK